MNAWWLGKQEGKDDKTVKGRTAVSIRRQTPENASLEPESRSMELENEESF